MKEREIRKAITESIINFSTTINSGVLKYKELGCSLYNGAFNTQGFTVFYIMDLY